MPSSKPKVDKDINFIINGKEWQLKLVKTYCLNGTLCGGGCDSEGKTIYVSENYGNNWCPFLFHELVN